MIWDSHLLQLKVFAGSLSLLSSFVPSCLMVVKSSLLFQAPECFIIPVVSFNYTVSSNSQFIKLHLSMPLFTLSLFEPSMTFRSDPDDTISKHFSAWWMYGINKEWRSEFKF